MSLTPGALIGLYRIVDQIGSGGMGEVYRATDTKLGRDVAIKTLPSSLANDPDRLARFEREAKVLATLNHAHIGAIYGLDEHAGTQFIAMELVEGQTLEERLKEGRLPVDTALHIALQVTEALEAAHDKGVVHRDLKPANIMLTPDGVVKVLDFGLAKAFLGDPNDASPAHSPALSLAMTQQGLILGTAGYMSPEQASGQATDQRADIWAFGVVLYEMLSGLPLFSGESVPHILADVLRSEPDWSRLPKNVPARIRLILKRCLAKKVRERYHSIADVRIEIEQALRDPGDSAVEGSTGTAQPLRRQALSVAATAAATLLVAGLLAWQLWPADVPQPVNRFDYTLPDGQQFAGTGRPLLTVSPNGRQFVYNTNNGLYLRMLSELDAVLMPATEQTRNSPIFSPDGSAVAYYDVQARLMRIAVSGGAPVTIAGDIENPFGLSWEKDGTILIGQLDGIYRVPASGGTPQLVIPIDDGLPFGPRLLPDGDRVLFSVTKATGWNGAEIVAQSIRTGERKVIWEGGSDARYLPTGHLVYALDDGLFGVAFDAASLTASGGAVPLVQGVMRASSTQTGTANYGVSDDGTLVYVSGTVDPEQRTLVWVARNGEETPITMPRRSYTYARLSPDDTKVALDVRDEENDIWIWDLVRETLTRLTFDPGLDQSPVWSPDDQQIVFSSTRGNTRPSLYRKAADGTGVDELLVENDATIFAATSFLPDGSGLMAYAGPGGATGNDEMMLIELDGEPHMSAVLESAYAENNPSVSPDGRWLAYVSDESGGEQVYVRPFPNVDGGRWQVSRDGGSQPLWGPDGRELFYRDGDSLIRVPIRTEPSFEAGNPEALFEDAYFLGPGARAYDVSADGERFLFVKEIQRPGARARIIIVENWFDEVRRLVPVE